MAKSKEAKTPEGNDSESGAAPIEMITLEKDIFGNPYLPGSEITVPKELYQVVHAHESSKVDHDTAKKKLTKAQQNLAAASIKFRSLFEGTKDGLHFLFNCAGIDVFVDRNEKVSTKPESSVKAGKRKKKQAGEKAAGKPGSEVTDIY